MRLIIVQKQPWISGGGCLSVGQSAQTMLLKPRIPPVCCPPCFLGNDGALEQGESGPSTAVRAVFPQVSAPSVSVCDSV